MSSLNCITLMGRTGKEPETRTTQAGKVVTKFSLATDHGFGEKKVTEWHQVVCFDKLAESVAKFVGKGCRVLVVGRMRYSHTTRDDGSKSFFAEVIADTVQFIDTRDDGRQASANGPGDVGNYGKHPSQGSAGYDDAPF